METISEVVKRMRIAFDLDSVFINIHNYEPAAPGEPGGWQWRHNRDYGHEKILTHWDFTEWDVSGIAAPSCGVKMYDYLKDPDFYDYAPPVEGSIEAFHRITKKHEAWFVTSGIHEGKYRWVARHGLTTLSDGDVKATNIITIDNKTILAPLFDVLVDDRAATCLDWEEAGGVAILFDQPWNERVRFSRRAYNWDDVEAIIKEME